ALPIWFPPMAKRCDVAQPGVACKEIGVYKVRPDPNAEQCVGVGGQRPDFGRRRIGGRRQDRHFIHPGQRGERLPAGGQLLRGEVGLGDGFLNDNGFHGSTRLLSVGMAAGVLRASARLYRQNIHPAAKFSRSWVTTAVSQMPSSPSSRGSTSRAAGVSTSGSK